MLFHRRQDTESDSKKTGNTGSTMLQTHPESEVV